MRILIRFTQVNMKTDFNKTFARQAELSDKITKLSLHFKGGGGKNHLDMILVRSVLSTC